MTTESDIRRWALDYAIATMPGTQAGRNSEALVRAAGTFTAWLAKGRVGDESARARRAVAATSAVAPPKRVTNVFTAGDMSAVADELRASLAAGEQPSWRALAKATGFPESTLRRYKNDIAAQAATKSGAADGPRVAVDATATRVGSEGEGARNASPIAVAPDTSRRPESEADGPLPRVPAGDPAPVPAVETEDVRPAARAPKRSSGLPNRGGVLKASDVEAIKRGYGNGAKVADMARTFEVSTARVYQICKGLARPDATDAALGRHKMPVPAADVSDIAPPSPPAVSRETPRPPIRSAVPGVARPTTDTAPLLPGIDSANVLRKAGKHCVWRPQSRTWAVDDREVSMVELRMLAGGARMAAG